MTPSIVDSVYLKPTKKRDLRIASLAASVRYAGEPGPTPMTNSFFGNMRVLSGSQIILLCDHHRIGATNSLYLSQLPRNYLGHVLVGVLLHDCHQVVLTV